MSGSETEDLVLSKLLSIGELKIELEDIDTTTLDSTNGFKESIPGLADVGDLPLSQIIDDETELVAMKALMVARTVEEWTIEFVSGSTWVAQAYVKAAGEGEATPEGKRTANYVLRVTGEPVFTPAA